MTSCSCLDNLCASLNCVKYSRESDSGVPLTNCVTKSALGLKLPSENVAAFALLNKLQTRIFRLWCMSIIALNTDTTSDYVVWEMYGLLIVLLRGKRNGLQTCCRPNCNRPILMFIKTRQSVPENAIWTPKIKRKDSGETPTMGRLSEFYKDIMWRRSPNSVHYEMLRI